jgi:hypothetical protein
VLLAGGVPAVAIAALINRRRDARAEADADAEGGEGSAAVLPGNVPEVIYAGALGVDTGQLAQYLESFTDEIGRIESRLDQFENDLMDFGQPPAQPQKPAEPKPQPVKKPAQPEPRPVQIPKPTPPKQPTKPASNPIRDRIIAIFEKLNRQGLQVGMPRADRLARLEDEVRRGRSYADIEYHLRLFAHNQGLGPHPGRDPQNFAYGA